MTRMDSRRARRMMNQMGMKMDELGDIKRVILQSDKREIVIEGPQVTSINVQGTKMYQVAGGRESERKPIQGAALAQHQSRIPCWRYLKRIYYWWLSRQTSASM